MTPQELIDHLAETIGGDWTVKGSDVPSIPWVWQQATCGALHVARAPGAGWVAWCDHYSQDELYPLRVFGLEPANALRALRAEMLQSMGPLAAPPRPDWRDTEPTREQAEAHVGLWLAKRLSGVVAVYFTGQGWAYSGTTVTAEIQAAKWCPCDSEFQAMSWPALVAALE